MSRPGPDPEQTTSFAAVPPARKRRRRWPWIVLGVFVLFSVIGALNRPVTPAPSPAAAAAAPAAAPAPAPAVDAQIAAWRDSGGLDRLNAITSDFGTVGTAGTAQDIGAMHTACQSMQSDTEAAQAFAPIPDPQAQKSWAAGLAQAARSASDCIAATTSGNLNPPLLSQAATEIGTASTDFQTATARITTIAAGG